ncbi:MAG: hypothetical protein F6K24_44815 [Okeania sp. SIO2D1]|nr:hypothetical protein [Okeania sp. SIO2D1]
MEFNYIKYCQYLISSQKNYTITNLADHLEKVSHDQINRYLKNIDLGTESLWQNVRKEIVTAEDGYLIFDDTVINKKYSQQIDSEAPLKEALVRRQYSGNEHRVVRGIGIVNCLYFNPQSSSILDDRLSYL